MLAHHIWVIAAGVVAAAVMGAVDAAAVVVVAKKVKQAVTPDEIGHGKRGISRVERREDMIKR